MRTRIAALLAVLALVGFTGVARGNSGDPLILGQDNVATSDTGLEGNLRVGGVLNPDQFAPAGAGVVSFRAGVQVVHVNFDILPGSLAIATVQNQLAATQYPDVAVAQAKINVRLKQLTITLNEPTPVFTVVAYLVFDPDGNPV